MAQGLDGCSSYVPPVFGSGKDLGAAGELTRMDPFAFLCLADAMGGGGIGDGKRDLLCICAGSRHCVGREGRKRNGQERKKESEG